MDDNLVPNGLSLMAHWRLSGFLFEIDRAEIVVHEGDEPNAVVDLLDAELLAGEGRGDVYLFSAHADAAASGVRVKYIGWIWLVAASTPDQTGPV